MDTAIVKFEPGTTINGHPQHVLSVVYDGRAAAARREAGWQAFHGGGGREALRQYVRAELERQTDLRLAEAAALAEAELRALELEVGGVPAEREKLVLRLTGERLAVALTELGEREQSLRSRLAQAERGRGELQERLARVLSSARGAAMSAASAWVGSQGYAQRRQVLLDDLTAAVGAALAQLFALEAERGAAETEAGQAGGVVDELLAARESPLPPARSKSKRTPQPAALLPDGNIFGD